jgi:hypothetical protein
MMTSHLRLLFKERFEPRPRVRRGRRTRLFTITTKGEILTKITPLLVKNRLSVRLATRVGILRIIQGAIAAAVEICATTGAGVTSPDPFFQHELITTTVTY